MSGSQQLLLGGIPTAAPVDPYFYSVTSLLHGDGVNGGQNNTFLDSSTNNFTITRNGNTTQGSFSPFSQTGWSNYFDGTGDYLSATSNAAFGMGSGDYTIECWLYLTGTPTYHGIYSTTGTTSSDIQIQLQNRLLRLSSYTAQIAIANAGTEVPLNQWTHVAFCRSGSTVRLFNNGIQVGSATDSTTWATGAIQIGQVFGLYPLNGYMSNLRVVKGTAVYTSNFTVPTTPLTAITNTSLLTCQSNRFLDASTNNFTITANGDVSVQPFSPFNPTTAYSTSSIGGSGYFDGSGDYLTLSGNPTLTTNFTIEFWFYMPSWGDRVFVAQGGGAASFSTSNGVAFQIYSTSTTFYAQWSNGAGSFAEINTATSGIATNAWHHVAIGNNGTTTRVWIDGVSIGTNTGTPTWGYPTTRSTYIGYISYSSSYVSLGYMAGVRMVTSDVYGAGNTTITVPTAPPTAVANTQLLCNFTNGAIFDNAAVADYETVGNAQISTSVKKYGTGSIAFDGTGDYLLTDPPSAQLMAFGTGDFTVEMWVYFNAIGTDVYHFYDSRPASTDGAYPTLRTNASAQIEYVANSAVRITGLTLTTNTWYHVALCRTASQTKLFVNGTQTGSTYADTTNYLNAAARPLIGGSGFHVTTLSLNGYVDDVRISKGVARYIYNFTPPTMELPNIGGTVTLTADPYFDYTTLLLPGNGTNGAQNNTFLDSSTNAFSITRNGNTTQGTFSPFSQTGWSNYFDGTGDYLSATSNAAFGMGSGDYTIECWLYLTGTPTYHGIYSTTGTTSSDIQIQLQNRLLRLSSYTAQIAIANAGTEVPLNQWTHVAFCRSGSTVRLFNNGTQVGSATDSTTWATGAIQIGQVFGLYPLSGYMSNLRVVKGTAVYTANFTPPTTPLTAIANTSLLTCQSNRFIDNSTNAFAITRNGDVSVQAFSPFNPTASWSAATYGGSGYFDGSGDFLTLASNTALDMGTGNFTVEMWVYSTDASLDTQNRRFFATEANGSGSIQLGHVTTTTGVAQYCDNGSLGALITGTTNILNQWAHIAAVRSGTTVTLYVNGVSEGTATDSGNKTSTAFTIGKYPGASGHLKGWLGSLRVVKGTAVYTGTFTPPTSPLTAISGTSLLLNYTNAGIYDATSKNDLETVGNAQISTTQSKFGGSSMYFDGTGDYLRAPTSNLWDFGTGDFTVEFWIRFAAIPTNPSVGTLIGKWGNGGGTYAWIIQANSALLRFYTGSNGSLGSPLDFSWSPSTNTWYHVAVTRYGTNLKTFIDGIQIGSTQTNSQSLSSTSEFCVIGENLDGGGQSQFLNGYINDLRITKGIARYTSNFTPPTTAFLTQ